jgi:hypothetical protein
MLVADGQWPAAGLRLQPHAALLTLYSPLLSLPSLPSISPRRWCWGAVEGAAFGRRRWRQMGCGVRGVGCDVGADAGATSRRVLRPDVLTLAFRVIEVR